MTSILTVPECPTTSENVLNYNLELRAINLFFECKDAFVSLPTGYGILIIFPLVPISPCSVGMAICWLIWN